MMQDGAQKLSPTQFQELLWRRGVGTGVALIDRVPAALLPCCGWLSVWRDREFAEYLALNWQAPRVMVLCVR